jgi:epoxyqueuosine reductase
MPGRVLIHICCGPCAVYPLKVLRDKGYEVMGLFYNPNIHPLQEYLQRAESADRAAQALGTRLIRMDREYDPVKYLRSVVFREEQRCRLCYQTRLERTRNIALKGGFDFFSTTLLFSKRQKHELIKSTGQALGTDRTAFLYQDFRAGWREGRETAQGMDLYRQNYCGCIYSEFERFQGKLDNS